ncbi:putative Fibronectin type-III domain-containing protein [Seiridium cardinale]|uniref:Fibronectin type-III domain-containing protein n=1 Tax=Seiridium cardinale TaxID=138064 RepID=A0ABR2XB93_9PEZI
MSWTPWTTSVPTVLVVCAVLAWWFTEPKTLHLNLIVVIGCLLFFWAVAPQLAQQSPAWLLDTSINIATFLRLDYLVLYHTNMLVTGAALLWLAQRTWQTLRKPVPELINILGVDVPDAPDVSLAGIRPDAATLHWTRPRANRPVSKFLIQVNGILVGESAPTETAITVTGLKPDHYYNVVIIAVGHNNFQAGSRVIRLCTFSKDGRPQLGDGRLPSNFDPEDQAHIEANTHDDDGTPRSPAAGVETASVSKETLVPPSSAGASGIARRNTLTRKHSPSTTSMDQSVREVLSKDPEESLQKLGERFESIRREMEEIQAQIGKDEKEHKESMDELADEKKSKRRILKEKDDTTERLKREMGSTDRAMRSSQQKKAQLEKKLNDKQTEWKKLDNEIAKFDKDIVQMSKRLGGFEKDKSSIQAEGDERIKSLRAELDDLQASLALEERELKEKGKELKEAEDQRKQLPGGEESDEWHETERQLRREWDLKHQELIRRLGYAKGHIRNQKQYEQVLQNQLLAAQQSGLGFPYNQANSSGVDFDAPMQNQLKRRSRTSNSMSNVVVPSPVSSFAIADRSYAPSSIFGIPRATTLPPGFPEGSMAQLPGMPTYGDFSTESTEDFVRSLDEQSLAALTGGAPLSPTATSLLPAGMLDMVDDDEPPSPASYPVRQGTFGSTISPENDPQSPVSSGRSLSISSPRSSSQNLPFSQYTGENSERSLRGELSTASPAASRAPPNNRFTLLPWLHRGEKSSDEPPALGSLKLHQSQSLPRQNDDSGVLSGKRRISLSGGGGWSMFNRNSAGPETLEGASSRGLPTRRGLFANTTGGAGFPERDPSSPRPVSIASSDLPRPSTESGPMWGRQHSSRIWSPENADPWSSRNVSRRPSAHGSPSALKTTLADADDVILDKEEILRRPSAVGVIGSRAPAKSFTQRLNPAAPSFMFSFRSKDRESNQGKEKDKSKVKPKDKAGLKEKRPRESLTSASETTDTPSMDESPSDYRKSRDAFSVDTPSISESRESLSLDQSFSNTPSEPAVGLGVKEPESGFRKLLRKGSSSKFSLSSIRGVAGKKGPGSVANSDKNQDRTSFDIDEHGEDSGSNAAGPTLLGRSYDSANSSPSLGPLNSGRPGTKEGRVGWGRFSMKKKSGRERESIEVDRDDSVPPTPSTTGDDNRA